MSAQGPAGPDDHAALVAARVQELLAARDGGARGAGSARAVLVCLDGRSGSGKTTLARHVTRLLRDGGRTVTVLHLDHVYPGWDGLAAASQVLGDRVLPRLRAGLPTTYPSWSWVRDRPGPEVAVRPADVVVVEGVGSGSRACRAAADLVVWLEAPEPVRHARAMARDGDAYRPHWRRWAAQEEAYVAAEDPAGGAHVRLGTASADVPGSP